MREVSTCECTYVLTPARLSAASREPSAYVQALVALRRKHAEGVVDGMLAAGYRGAGELVTWETGKGLMADQDASVAYKREKASEGAAKIKSYQKNHPGKPVDLLGFSAGTAEAIFGAPKSDYTRALLEAIPRLDRADRGGRPEIRPLAPDAPVIAEGRDVEVYFPIAGGLLGKARTLRACPRRSTGSPPSRARMPAWRRPARPERGWPSRRASWTGCRRASTRSWTR